MVLPLAYLSLGRGSSYVSQSACDRCAIDGRGSNGSLKGFKSSCIEGRWRGQCAGKGRGRRAEQFEVSNEDVGMDMGNVVQSIE